MNNSQEPSYEIIRPDYFPVSEANQKLLDEGFGSWGKSVNAELWLNNGGMEHDLIYLFHYYPITGEVSDKIMRFVLPDPPSKETKEFMEEMDKIFSSQSNEP